MIDTEGIDNISTIKGKYSESTKWYEEWDLTVNIKANKEYEKLEIWQYDYDEGYEDASLTKICNNYSKRGSKKEIEAITLGYINQLKQYGVEIISYDIGIEELRKEEK